MMRVFNTPYEKHLFEFIETYVSRNGYPPLVKEILHGIGRDSVHGFYYALDSLEAQGHIVRLHGKHRGLRILPPPQLGAEADRQRRDTRGDVPTAAHQSAS